MGNLQYEASYESNQNLGTQLVSSTVKSKEVPCPHCCTCYKCDDFVSLRMYKMHKIQYYNPYTKQWSKKQNISRSKENKDDFEDDMIIISML